jgi:hypothetical protein
METRLNVLEPGCARTLANGDFSVVNVPYIRLLVLGADFKHTNAMISQSFAGFGEHTTFNLKTVTSITWSEGNHYSYGRKSGCSRNIDTHFVKCKFLTTSTTPVWKRLPTDMYERCGKEMFKLISSSFAQIAVMLDWTVEAGAFGTSNLPC